VSVTDPQSRESDRKSGVDLRGLPRPRRTSRTLALGLMALTAVLAAALGWSLRGEVVFALTEREPIELGSFAEAELGPQHEGRLVRAQVQTQKAALRFRRPFETTSHRVAAVAAKSPSWIVYAVPASLDGPRFVPPTLVTGRLVRVEDAGPRYRGLGTALQAGGWVLLDGDAPTDLAWLIGLEALLGAFVAFTVGGMVAVLRPVRSRVG
jgi:hypothetical protein